MSSHKFNTVYENPKLCNDCKKVLKTHNITNKKEFITWARTNHPDKGGNGNIFGLVSGCNDEYFGTNKSCDINKDYSYMNSSNKPPPHREKPSHHRASPKQHRKACNPNQVRNPKSGRCVLKSSPLGKKIMKEMGGSRKTSSRRSRRASSQKTSSRRASPKKHNKACNANQVRNPKSGRCVLKSSPLGKKIMKEMGGSRKTSSRRASSRKTSSRRASSQKTSSRRASPKKHNKACNVNQVRNPKSGRCVLKSSALGKKIMKERKE